MSDNCAFVLKIVADNWNGVICNEEEISSPTHADVVRVIDELNAKTRTMVSLYGNYWRWYRAIYRVCIHKGEIVEFILG